MRIGKDGMQGGSREGLEGVGEGEKRGRRKVRGTAQDKEIGTQR